MKPGGTPITEPSNNGRQTLRIFPIPPETLESDGPYAGFQPPREKDGLPYTAINTVVSLDGKVSRDGKSQGIGSEADWRAMRNLRAASDAVIIGAGSLRAERMSLGVPETMASERRRAGKPPQPLAVIIGGLQGLPIRENLMGYSPENTLIILPETADEKYTNLASKLGAFEYLREEAGLRGVLSSLKSARGVEFALVEGGPSLSWSLISESLVDEMFLTVSPKLLGGRSPSVIEGLSLSGAVQDSARLVSAHVSAEDLFLRYRLNNTQK